MALIGSGEANVTREVGGGVSNPGNFLLRECSIMRENLGGQELGNQKLNITKFVSNVQITESIYKNAINVNIRILDVSSLYSSLRLNGSEKIKIELARNDDTIVEVFRLELVVADVHQFSEINGDAQSYVLRCVPEYTLINQTTTISDSFIDIVEAIKSICQGVLNIPTLNLDRPLRKDRGRIVGTSDDKGVGNFLSDFVTPKGDSFELNLQPTQEEVDKQRLPAQPARGIYPLMKPLSVINWLVRNISNNSTPYYFYQTSDGRVRLRSYQQMINDVGAFTPYTNVESSAHYSINDPMKDSTDSLFKFEKFKIKKFSQPSNLSSVKNIADGSYASNKHTIDIYKKEYKDNDNFEYGGMKTLNESKPFPDKVKFNEKKFTDNHTSKNYYINLNSGAFDDLENYHNIVNDTIQKKEAYHHILDSQIQDIVIDGDFLLRSGQTITLDILQNKSADKKLKDEELDTPDKMLSGKYLITAIEHNFENQTFLTRLRLKRDSYNLDLNEPEKTFKDNTFTVDT